MSDRERIQRLTLLLAVLLVGALACNDHELYEFSASVDIAAIEPTEKPEVRPVDILFMIDDSSSMCEEQEILVDEFDIFIAGLAGANADFRLAVVNSDMLDAGGGSDVGGQGNLRLQTGTFNAPQCNPSPGLNDALATCASGLSAEESAAIADGIIERADFPSFNATNPDTFEPVQRAFSCLGLTGIDGNGVEMGLETVRLALEKNKDTFLREGALLAIVFVADENDCSDTTTGQSNQGPVYETISAPDNAAGDSHCDWSRNIEDSCAIDPNPITVTFNDEVDEVSGLPRTETRSAYDWCIQGQREVVEVLAQAPSARASEAYTITCPPERDPEQCFVTTNCPDGGCADLLTPRRELYDYITSDAASGGLGYAPEDVIVASIVNQDTGFRFDPPTRVATHCGPNDKQGYRYEQFARMFDSDRRVIAPICNTSAIPGNGDPEPFGDDLGLISNVIGRALNNVCLRAEPTTCLTSADCPEEQLCGECPAGETCISPVLTFTDPFFGEYKLCSGFDMRVQVEVDGSFATLERGDDADYTLDFQAGGVCPDSPIQIRFESAPAGDLRVAYPRSLSRDID